MLIGWYALQSKLDIIAQLMRSTIMCPHALHGDGSSEQSVEVKMDERRAIGLL